MNLSFKYINIYKNKSYFSNKRINAFKKHKMFLITIIKFNKLYIYEFPFSMLFLSKNRRE